MALLRESSSGLYVRELGRCKPALTIVKAGFGIWRIGDDQAIVCSPGCAKVRRRKRAPYCVQQFYTPPPRKAYSGRCSVAVPGRC